MELNKLTYLDKSCLQKILRDIKSDESIEVSDLIIKPAVPKGENYLSELFRVSLEFTQGRNDQKITEKASLIVKSLPIGDFREEMISNADLFKTELSMMSKTLPKMNEILSAINITPLAAQCLHSQSEVPIYLIIEDLMPKGFRMANRLASLDLTHCSLALRKLAAFHASSVALREKDPKIMTQYWRGMFHKDNPSSLAAYFNLSTKALGEEVAKWDELSPRLSEKILKLSEVMYEKVCENAEFREDDFNVLNHGDFWVNNMMFLYNEQEKPIDIMFVDFQMCRYGTPALDLLYFLATSPHEDLRAYERESLLREYHISLTNTMAELKCTTKAPSIEKLRKMVEERAFYGLNASMNLLPIILVDEGNQKTLDEIMGADGTFEYDGFKSKLYRKEMNRVLPLFDSMGLLDL